MPFGWERAASRDARCAFRILAKFCSLGSSIPPQRAAQYLPSAAFGRGSFQETNLADRRSVGGLAADAGVRSWVPWRALGKP
jgi:hypothetical protein